MTLGKPTVSAHPRWSGCSTVARPFGNPPCPTVHPSEVKQVWHCGMTLGEPKVSHCPPFCSEAGAALWHHSWELLFINNSKLTVEEYTLTKFRGRRHLNFNTRASDPQTDYCPQTVSLTSLHLLITLINILKEIAPHIDIDNEDLDHYYINYRTFLLNTRNICANHQLNHSIP